MSRRTTPPFRADHVGSLLRPPALLEARARRKAGEIDAERAARGRGRGDPRRRAACRRRSGCSRRPTASSAARRGTWTSSTSSAASTRPTRSSRCTFHNADRRARLRAGRAQRRTTGSRPAAHDLRDDFSFLRTRSRRASRSSTIPSPSMVHYRGGRPRSTRPSTRTSTSSGPTSPAAYARGGAPRSRSSAAPTCSSTTRAWPTSTTRTQRAHVASIGGDARAPARAVHPRIINAALAGRPERADRHHAHVPRQLPLVVGGRGRLRLRRRGAVRRARGRRLLPRVRRRALRRLRAAALRAAGQAGRARAGHHQARRAREQGRRSSGASTRPRSSSRSTSSASRRSAASPRPWRATRSTTTSRWPSCADRRDGARGLGLRGSRGSPSRPYRAAGRASRRTASRISPGSCARTPAEGAESAGHRRRTGAGLTLTLLAGAPGLRLASSPSATRHQKAMPPDAP